jgi:hypothetical protein
MPCEVRAAIGPYPLLLETLNVAAVRLAPATRNGCADEQLLEPPIAIPIPASIGQRFSASHHAVVLDFIPLENLSREQSRNGYRGTPLRVSSAYSR